MICVVVPARNEAASVAAVVREVRAALADEAHEILVVDDGSTDATAAEARQAGARVVQGPGLGYGAAILAGVAQARGEWLGIIDADGSYPAEALPALLALARAGAAQAIGARPAFPAVEPLARSLLKLVARAFVHAATGLRLPDLNSGLRVVRLSLVRELAPKLPQRFSLTTTLTLLLAARGVRQSFLSIEYRPRAGRSKWRALRDTALFFRTVARGVREIRAARHPAALALPAKAS